MQLRKNIIPTKLKLKGKAGWDSTISPVTKPGRGDADSEIKDVHALSIRHIIPRCTAFFNCPLCQRVEPSTCEAFQCQDLDKKQRCTSCKKRSPVKLWKCSCDKKWHICSIHKKDARPTSCQPTVTTSNGQPPEPSRSSGRKRTLPPSYLLSYEEMRLEDFNVAQRKQRRLSLNIGDRVVSLGNFMHGRIKPNFLSPNLKQRFMGGSR